MRKATQAFWAALFVVVGAELAGVRVSWVPPAVAMIVAVVVLAIGITGLARLAESGGAVAAKTARQDGAPLRPKATRRPEIPVDETCPYWTIP